MPAETALAPPPPTAPVALFISDIHLQQDAPRTAQAFFDFLARHAHGLQQLYLLGDLFEYWAGDDDLPSPFNARVVAALHAASNAGTAVFWMAGNRDFLIGERFATAAGLTLLPDPSVVTIAGRTIVLAHGDAQCTDDLDYQAFRTQVRDPQWQRNFLAQPLADRLAVIARMREGSRNAQRGKTEAIMDVNPESIDRLFSSSGASTMIHGHTHRPGMHDHAVEGKQRKRHVLTDWECEGMSARGGALAVHADGTIVPVALES
jgi:UDP-2,3-diacylglucosamine hydrolase